MTEEIRAGLPPGDRGRLPEHRHRLLDAGRPLEPTRRRAAARELPARGRAHGAHPRARARRRDGQRRRRDRRGRQAELDRGGAAGLPRRLSTRARARVARARSGSARSASRPARATAASRCPDGGVAEVKLDFDVLRRLGEVARSYGLAGAVQHGASRCRTSCSTTSRRSRRPRSISRPASRTCSSSTRPSRRRSIARSTTGASRTRSTNASPTRPTSSSSTRRRKKAIGPFKRQLWELPTKDEILAAQRRKIGFLFSELQVGGSREMVDRYIAPVEAHRPMPEALRAVAAS